MCHIKHKDPEKRSKRTKPCKQFRKQTQSTIKQSNSSPELNQKCLTQPATRQNYRRRIANSGSVSSEGPESDSESDYHDVSSQSSYLEPNQELVLKSNSVNDTFISQEKSIEVINVDKNGADLL